MSDEVIIALISALSAVVLAIVGGGSVHLHKQQKKRDEHLNTKLDDVKYQVANDHDTNLRHDIDAVTNLVGSVKGILENLVPQVTNLQTTMNNMDQRVLETDRRAIKVAEQFADHILSAQRRDERITLLEGKFTTKEIL